MSVLDLIGNTPLINFENIYVKMEMMNPSGSIKDRVALEMLRPYINGYTKNITVVEATSGNTGISVAMVCAAAGFKAVIMCPYGTSKKKIKLMKSYGATVYGEWTNIKAAINQAIHYKRTHEKTIYLNQFNNIANIEAQKRMGFEADNQLFKLNRAYTWIYRPKAIVAGTGTGGTLMGLHMAFPNADVYEVHPTGDLPIEGITDNVVQPLIPINLKRRKIGVPLDKAKSVADYLAQKKGISCGYSSGANYYAACMIAKSYNKVLTVFPDNRIRYL